ncbi:PREDICTED: sodium-independent sulfate anion transporter-like isoform X4 [Trachymyrmex cornetzi]|uniref:sodium-independent sulfate anion transporter-like isoform X4 n=1 Tax=Trachymyrmex cornetzi TaxID=471704 RepID=UPI00084F764F|nr:PREDICTED: sodium-independent sulfate anion transporter-like isoform X4 [Trachymyrmex cornetzi]
MSLSRGTFGETISLLSRPNVILSQSCNLKRLLLRRIPILAWLPLYSWSKLLQDTLAGLTVGLTAIPQGIAYAIVAGLPAQYGLYSSFMGCFVYLVFGSCKDVTVGPTAIMALMVQKYVNSMGEDIAVLVCFLSGAVITFMGILHLGFLVDFISMPVISGFSNAAAIIIATSQLGTLLGIKGRSDSFIDAISHVVKHINETQLWDTVLGVCSMVLLILFKKLPGKKQGTPFQKFMWLISLARNAIVVMAGILIAYELYSHDIKPFQITGNITEGLPPFSLPPFTIVNGNHTYTFTEIVSELSSSILSIPLIAILESIAIAKAFEIDLVPLIVTLLCCLAISLEYGMIIGIAVNLILLLYFAARPGLLIEERIVDGLTVLFVSPKQSLSFPAAEYLRERVMSWCDKRPISLPVVIEGRHVLRIDATVAKNLALLLSDLITRNQKIIFWNWCEDAKQTLISYDSSFETYCKSSGSIARIFTDETVIC